MSTDGKIETLTAKATTINDLKSAGTHQTSIDGSETNATWVPRGADPELAAAIAQISPERRMEVEKRLLKKLDFIMFPVLLVFYILNYLVSLSLILLGILFGMRSSLWLW